MKTKKVWIVTKKYLNRDGSYTRPQHFFSSKKKAVSYIEDVVERHALLDMIQRPDLNSKDAMWFWHFEVKATATKGFVGFISLCDEMLD